MSRDIFFLVRAAVPHGGTVKSQIQQYIRLLADTGLSRGFSYTDTGGRQEGAPSCAHWNKGMPFHIHQQDLEQVLQQGVRRSLSKLSNSLFTKTPPSTALHLYTQGEDYSGKWGRAAAASSSSLWHSVHSWWFTWLNMHDFTLYSCCVWPDNASNKKQKQTQTTTTTKNKKPPP